MMRPYLFGNGKRKKGPKLKTDNCAGIKPQMRANGKPVTMRNCTGNDCAWPYGAPGADMVLCGRPVDSAPYCKEHRAVAYKREPAGGTNARQT